MRKEENKWDYIWIYSLMKLNIVISLLQAAAHKTFVCQPVKLLNGTNFLN